MTAIAPDPTTRTSLQQPDTQDRLVIESPRTRRQRPSGNRSKTNYEMYAWIFMRVSGLLLVVLVLGHLVIMNILDGGVQRINFAFVAGRWASPFWQTWDLAQLWLAQLHGTNGLLYTSSVLVLMLGTLVIFTFDPNI